MVAVIVLDALHVPLIERLVSEGRMPTLRGLRDDGHHIPLTSSADYLEGSIHTSLNTGLHAAGHGVFSPFQWSAEEQRIQLRDSFNVPPALWERVGEAGRRSLLIDPYDSVAPRSLLGTGVRGWQLTNRVALAPWSTDGVRRRLSRRFGRAKPGNEIYGEPALRELFRLRTLTLEAQDRIPDALGVLLPEADHDLVWIDFAAMHLAGHQFFDVNTVTPTQEISESDLALFDATLAEVYETGDRALGRVVELLPSDADILIVAPTTMVAEADRSDLLPQMLDAVLDGGADEDEPSERWELWRVRGTIPSSLRRSVALAIPDRVALRLTSRLITSGIDWGSTRALAIPGDPGGAIRLNLRGREREGIVDPTDARALEDEIIEGLMTFRDEDGANTIRAVERTLELEPAGPLASLLPDLVVSWRREPPAPLSQVSSQRFGTVRRRGIGSGRSGNHAGGGWAILPGGSEYSKSERPARLVDIAATACALLDVDTDGLPGEPLLKPR